MSQPYPQQSRPAVKHFRGPSSASSAPAFSPNMQGQTQARAVKGPPPFAPPPPPPPPHHHPTVHLSQSQSLAHVASPIASDGADGSPPALAASHAPGSMGPPLRPREKDRDKTTDIRTLEDPLAGTGVNLDEEERNLTSSSFGAPDPPRSGSLACRGPDAGTATAGSFYQASPGSLGDLPEESAEAQRRKAQAMLALQAGRWAQNPLWDSFLQGDPMEKRLNHCAYENGIKSPKDGLFLATKGSTKPQTTQVIGHDGATQIIDRGQTILSTESGEALSDVMKLVSLAARDRVTGLLDHSGRLACERRDHSAGRIPSEWKEMAVGPTAEVTSSPADEGAVASKALKRTFSQVEDGQSARPPHKLISVFRKVSDSVRDAERARLAKRAQRASAKVAEAGGSSGAATPSGSQTPVASSAEAEKRLTKKDRKAVQDKMSDALQQKSANETARMAMGLGAPSKFKKKYSWLNNGAAASPSASLGPASTRTGAPPSSGQSTPGTLAPKTSSVLRATSLGDWKETDHVGIQARDVLLVLETDGKAVKALSKAYNVPDRSERR